MTKQELLKKLEDANNTEPESGHSNADQALIEYIDDPEVKEAYEKLTKWYA